MLETASTEDNEPLLDAFGVDAGFNMQVSQPCNQLLDMPQ